METKVTERVAPLPPEAKRRELPYAAVRLLVGGAVVNMKYGGDAAAVCVEMGGQKQVLHEDDYGEAVRIASRLEREWARPAGLMADIGSPTNVLKAHEMASKWVGSDSNLRRILMLKDTSGSGWWRMVVPARHMTIPGWACDVTSGQVPFENLLEYDTVFVQRVHDWESYYVLDKVRKSGRRLVYDLDDDIFNIPRDNPASKLITRDEQMAAMACMKLAHAVTTTTDYLAGRLGPELKGTDLFVIPNALDPSDGWQEPGAGSPDGVKRIFWQGSATHAVDWDLCFGAIRRIMSERDDVRLVILGFLPPQVAAEASAPMFKDRIEYLGFSAPETYYQLIHHVRAEVGIAPLGATPFNAAKSPIKFLEYSLMGLPTVASFCLPYTSVVDGRNGFLAQDEDEWHEALSWCLDKTNRRIDVVKAARRTVEQFMDVRKTAKEWEKVLCGRG
jgi:glycosyltransferase involved in cell wall biosynthesis